MCPTLTARSGSSTGSCALLLPLEPGLYCIIPPAALEPVCSHLQSGVVSEGKGEGVQPWKLLCNTNASGAIKEELKGHCA